MSLAQKAALTPEQRDARRGVAVLRHSMMTRLKVMCGIAFLRGNAQPTDQDWVLAGVVMRVCLGTLAFLERENKTTQAQAARAKGALQGLERHAAQGALDEAYDAEVEETLGLVYRRLLREGSRTRTELYRTGDTAKKQKMVKPAIDRGIDRGLITAELDANNKPTGRLFPVHRGVSFDAAMTPEQQAEMFAGS